MTKGHVVSCKNLSVNSLPHILPCTIDSWICGGQTVPAPRCWRWQPRCTSPGCFAQTGHTATPTQLGLSHAASDRCLYYKISCMSSLNPQITRSWNKWFRFGTGSILGLPRSRRCDTQQATPRKESFFTETSSEPWRLKNSFYRHSKHSIQSTWHRIDGRDASICRVHYTSMWQCSPTVCTDSAMLL